MIHNHPVLYRQVLFYTSVTFLKKSHKSNTKFQYKTVYSLGVRGLTSSTDLWKKYIYIHISMQYTYMSIQYIYLFLIHCILYGSFWQHCGSLATRTLHFRSLAFHVIKTCSTFFNSLSIITNCTYGTMSNIMAYVNISFIFFKSNYYIWFLFIINCLLLIFHLDCIRWCRFMFQLVTNASVVEEITKWLSWLYHQHNQSIYVTEGVTMMSLAASLLQKISATTDHLCQDWWTSLRAHAQIVFKFWKNSLVCPWEVWTTQ